MANTLKDAVNSANPNVLSDQFRLLGLGDILAGLPTTLRKKDPAASAFSLATVLALALPSDAKAASIVRATVRAGGVTGELTPVAYGVTPATGEVAVGPNGDIVTLAADAITDMDVVYMPEKCDVVDLTLPVATHILTIPSTFTAKGVVLLMEVTATVGSSTGKKIVLVPGAGAPAAGQARLNIAKSTITFAAADAVTEASVKIGVASAADVSALLSATATIS